MEDQDYISVQEMAAMHSVSINTIHRILWADQDKPTGEQRIPGAVKVGSVRRGDWQIPRESAQNWQRDARGRKSKKGS